MVLSAFPLPPSELRTLFSGGPDGIRRLLERPPVLRAAGWDLETGDQARTINGEFVRVANGDRKILDLYRDGTLIFVCRVDDWFLAWGTPRGLQRINPLALVEVIYSFVDFYSRVIADLKQRPADVHFRIDLRNMHADGIKTVLGPYHLESYAQAFGHELRQAPENDIVRTRTFSVTGFDAAAVAYELVRDVYIWFGIEEEKIPYMRTDEGTHRVDTEAIKNTK